MSHRKKVIPIEEQTFLRENIENRKVFSKNHYQELNSCKNLIQIGNFIYRKLISPSDFKILWDFVQTYLNLNFHRKLFYSAEKFQIFYTKTVFSYGKNYFPVRIYILKVNISTDKKSHRIFQKLYIGITFPTLI